MDGSTLEKPAPKLLKLNYIYERVMGNEGNEWGLGLGNGVGVGGFEGFLFGGLKD